MISRHSVLFTWRTEFFVRKREESLILGLPWLQSKFKDSLISLTKPYLKINKHQKKRGLGFYSMIRYLHIMNEAQGSMHSTKTTFKKAKYQEIAHSKLKYLLKTQDTPLSLIYQKPFKRPDMVVRSLIPTLRR